eukprot:CAMPEP_0113232274 /NCGR_PEP_ID=MMETSP0008_2-20120614/1862_1 /TAXON_ID=97485 /ORGANISM="Prymnesium parvum" /LENGTH=202 /DNA_ID=CAMNT_0000078977 /DNA_START=164 /DNA_END=772 /DNA_ORIENTATION=+ /assembly_acc=CAM_ASM_000153
MFVGGVVQVPHAPFIRCGRTRACIYRRRVGREELCGDLATILEVDDDAHAVLVGQQRELFALAPLEILLHAFHDRIPRCIRDPEFVAIATVTHMVDVREQPNAHGLGIPRVRNGLSVQPVGDRVVHAISISFDKDLLAQSGSETLAVGRRAARPLGCFHARQRGRGDALQHSGRTGHVFYRSIVLRVFHSFVYFGEKFRGRH